MTAYIRFFILAFILAMTSLSLIQPISAFPTRSTTVEQKGMTTVESPAPWISGWNLKGQADNLSHLLKLKSQQDINGVYVILCATWEASCAETLQFIQRQRGYLESENIDVIAIFTEDIQAKELQQWLDQKRISSSSHFDVIIDRYHRSAIRTGAYEERLEMVPATKGLSSPTDDEDQIKASTSKQERVKRLRLPLGLVLSTDGTVLSIVTQSGADLIKHITQVIRYSGG